MRGLAALLLLPALAGCAVHSSLDDISASDWAARAAAVDRMTQVRDDCAPEEGIRADAFTVQVIDGEADRADAVRCIAAALAVPQLEAALDAGATGHTGVDGFIGVEWSTQGRVFSTTVSVGAFA